MATKSHLVALLAIFTFLGCKTLQNRSSSSAIDRVAGHPDEIDLSWPCSGNSRPNSMVDDDNVPFPGITQEEYCEWDDNKREEASGISKPLNCAFRTSFDGSRDAWLPQRAPRNSLFRPVGTLVNKMIRGKKVLQVGKESGEEFKNRIRQDLRKFWDTQFNTFPALKQLVADCSVQGVKCEDIACVPDRASDPLICGSVQALKFSNKCQLGIKDYTKESGDFNRPLLTANALKIKQLNQRSIRQAAEEVLFNIEWQLAKSDILKKNEHLPQGVWDFMKNKLVKMGIMSTSQPFPEGIKPENFTRISLAKAEIDLLNQAAEARWEEIGDIEDRVRGDTDFKLQLKFTPGVAKYCRFDVDKTLTGRLKTPDHTYIHCNIPAGDDGITGDDEIIKSCDDFAKSVSVVARFVATQCEVPLDSIFAPSQRGSIEAADMMSRRSGPPMNTFQMQKAESDKGGGFKGGRL